MPVRGGALGERQVVKADQAGDPEPGVLCGPAERGRKAEGAPVRTRNVFAQRHLVGDR